MGRGRGGGGAATRCRPNLWARRIVGGGGGMLHRRSGLVDSSPAGLRLGRRAVRLGVGRAVGRGCVGGVFLRGGLGGGQGQLSLLFLLLDVPGQFHVWIFHLAVGGGNLLFGDRLLLLEVLLAFFESVPLIGFIVLLLKQGSMEKSNHL